MAIIDKPSDYFNTKLYTGNGNAGNAQTGVGFQPDLVWYKSRGTADSGGLQDSVRGATKNLYPNYSDAENTIDGVSSFNSDGFTVGADNSANKNATAIVAWNWKAGTSFTNDASSTGIGTIDSAGSVNTDAGFSIISYTGTGSNGTIAHGLGAKPDMILIKNRSNGQQWSSYWSPLGATKYMRFATTNAVATASNRFANTEPTTSVFTVSTDGEVNENGLNLIAYCFTNIQGYSKVGSYVGNGNADGTFVYTGFKPAWVMCKITNTTDDWYIFNNKMPGYNLINESLRANTNDAQNSTGQIDFTSNGFKTRTSNYAVNGGSQSYIYMAFAENPFVASNFNPATAR